MSITVTPLGQKVLSRYHDGGTDWGANRRLIAETEDGRRRLFIRGGHRAANGAYGFGDHYVPTALVLETPWSTEHNGFSPRRTYLHEGRINLRTLEHFAPQIDAVFGPGATARLTTRTTTVFQSVRDASAKEG